jgi:competence protein ComGC
MLLTMLLIVLMIVLMIVLILPLLITVIPGSQVQPRGAGGDGQHGESREDE